MKLKSLSQPCIALISRDLIAWTYCPFTASWADVKAAAARLPNRAGMQDWAARVLAEIKPKLKQYANKPDMCGYLTGSGEANNPHTHVLGDSRTTACVAFFRAVFYGFGIVTQAKVYKSLFGKWLAYAGGATTFSELNTGAEALARFIAMAIQDLGLAGLERFITFIRTKNADEVKATGGSVAQIAAKAGMREMHLSRWSEWRRRNQALTALRTSEEHGNPIIDGSSTDPGSDLTVVIQT
ncbi:MAG: hypothetical protein KIT09_19930 [Bryobacteraceae bacterium]|nr:hypothetical protein [Bryobacteraceae bacterium]